MSVSPEDLVSSHPDTEGRRALRGLDRGVPEGLPLMVSALEAAGTAVMTGLA